jgi:hypothetical protein
MSLSRSSASGIAPAIRQTSVKPMNSMAMAIP